MRIQHGSTDDISSTDGDPGWLTDRDMLRHDFTAKPPKRKHAPLSKTQPAAHPSSRSRATAGKALTMQLLGGWTHRRGTAEVTTDPAASAWSGQESSAESTVAQRLGSRGGGSGLIKGSRQGSHSHAEAEDSVEPEAGASRSGDASAGAGSALQPKEAQQQRGAREEQDTYMVRLYKGAEQQSKAAPGDPAVQRGSKVREVPTDHPIVQRMMGLGKGIEVSRRRRMAEGAKVQSRPAADSVQAGTAAAASARKRGSSKRSPSSRQSSQVAEGGQTGGREGKQWVHDVWSMAWTSLDDVHMKCCDVMKVLEGP